MHFLNFPGRGEVINPEPETRLLKILAPLWRDVWPESWRRLRLISTLLLLLLIWASVCVCGSRESLNGESSTRMHNSGTPSRGVDDIIVAIIGRSSSHEATFQFRTYPLGFILFLPLRSLAVLCKLIRALYLTLIMQLDYFKALYRPRPQSGYNFLLTHLLGSRRPTICSSH